MILRFQSLSAPRQCIRNRQRSVSQTRPFARNFRSESPNLAISFAKPFAIAGELIRSAKLAAFLLRFGGHNSLANSRGASEFAFAFAAVSLRPWCAQFQTCRIPPNNSYRTEGAPPQKNKIQEAPFSQNTCCQARMQFFSDMLRVLDRMSELQCQCQSCSPKVRVSAGNQNPKI